MGKPCLNVEYHGTVWASMGSVRESKYLQPAASRTIRGFFRNKPERILGKSWVDPNFPHRISPLPRSACAGILREYFAAFFMEFHSHVFSLTCIWSFRVRLNFTNASIRQKSPEALLQGFSDRVYVTRPDQAGSATCTLSAASTRATAFTTAPIRIPAWICSTEQPCLRSSASCASRHMPHPFTADTHSE